MRIGVFTDTYSPQINGVVTSINTFIHELEKRGHKVYIFAPHVKGAEKKDNIFYFKSFKYPMSPEHQLAYSTSGHMKAFRELNLDIIHSHTPFTVGLLAIFLAKQYQIPLVHTYHTLFTEYVHYIPFGEKIGLHFSRNASKRYCQKCDLVIVPSYCMRKELQDYGVTQEIDVIPTGVILDHESKDTRDKIRKNLQIDPTTKVLLYMGRIAKEKNIEFLLRVYYDILKARKNILFVIIGDGPYRDHIEKRAKDLGLTKNILFTGYISEKKILANWLKAADVFTFSSLSETQGLVILEAMLQGTPVVAVDSMGVSDVINDNKGGLASSLDEVEFALKLNRLLSDKDLRNRKSKEAVAKAHSLSIDNLTIKLLSNYQRLIDVATKI